MAATDRTVTLAAILEWEAPDGDVRLADGGVVKFDSGAGVVSFIGKDPVFGTIAGFDIFESGVGDQVEGGEISFAPASDATVSDWWRSDLENTRARIWLTEVGSDGVSAESATLLADWLVDTASRDQGDGGRDVLSVEFMTRLQKLFEIRQGNVCSDRFHQSIWSGERGFENCHDGPQYFAWGTEAPRGSGGSGGSGGGGGGGGNSSPSDNQER